VKNEDLISIPRPFTYDPISGPRQASDKGRKDSLFFDIGVSVFKDISRAGMVNIILNMG
jgi:hypothetical protein